MRWSSVMVEGPLFGEEGHCVDDCPEANGEDCACQPGTLRISADVCLLGKLVGGEDTSDRGCGGGGGGGGA